MGIGNNELILFEEQNYEELVEEFLLRYAGEWNSFLLEQYSNYMAGNE